jgi:site-specific DNA-methyltransferase (adenine-specific)
VSVTTAQTISLHCSDNIIALKSLPANSVDSVVTDPPYGLSQHSADDVANALKAWVGGKEYLVRKKGFMGKTWDSFVPGPELWKEVYRVLKPGGHILCFAGSRTDDLMGISLRLAGFEVRDKIMWLYGSGFPKSRNIGKDMDTIAGVQREIVGTIKAPGMAATNVEQGAQGRETYTFDKLGGPVSDNAKRWEGWGTALKPAFEPIIVARKPLEGTIAANVLKHGVGGINIDGCRVGSEERTYTPKGTNANASMIRVPEHRLDSAGDEVTVQGRFPANIMHDGSPEVEGAFAAFGDKSSARSSGNPNEPKRGENHIATSYGQGDGTVTHDFRDEGTASRFFYNTAEAPKGRFPANIMHDGSPEVEEAFAAFGEKTSGTERQPRGTGGIWSGESNTPCGPQYGDSGSVSRFFYNSKASKADRAESKHPTVKPVKLMRYLTRLVTPPGGTVLDPFAGSGSTGQAAIEEGFNVILMERETAYQQDIARRCDKIIAARPGVVLHPIVHRLPDEDED